MNDSPSVSPSAEAPRSWIAFHAFLNRAVGSCSLMISMPPARRRERQRSEQRVPLIERDFVEDVDDRDRVEGAGDDVVEADDEVDAVDAAHFARIRFDGDDAPRLRQHREQPVTGADVEQRCARRQRAQHAQHRRGQEAEQDVDAVARRAFAENAVQYD